MTKALRLALAQSRRHREAVLARKAVRELQVEVLKKSKQVVREF